ncbi:Uncharacterised protein [Raoultella terrigena]|uniref:Uncharacterized protein n=1 Tax=Raoultella terrigena TaxID=577 RepID=A0A3P8M319_RAOTE|nr:Uncharacterised protein [Raoultella terrigena]
MNKFGNRVQLGNVGHFFLEEILYRFTSWLVVRSMVFDTLRIFYAEISNDFIKETIASAAKSRNFLDRCVRG